MQKDILIINEHSNVAICTLWTQKEKVLEKIDEETKNKISIIGTLYTSFGINYMLETLGEFNNINTIIIFGNDLSDSGDELIKVFSGNLEKLRVNKESARKIVSSIKLIDLRNEAKKENFSKLLEAINKNFKKGKKREKVRIKIEESKIASWPEELIGQRIFETSVFRAWIKILKFIYDFGFLKQTEYGEIQKEVLNLLVNIRLNGKYEIEKGFERYFPRKIFEKHIKETLCSAKPKGVEYTYGERLFKHEHAKNQVDFIIEKLSKKPYSRRAIAITWLHEKDMKSSLPPCIIAVQGTISGNEYHHFVFIRSNDMARAWPINIIGQIKLAEYIVKKINEKANTNYKLGSISSLSFSAHIYEHDFPFVERVIKENKNLLSLFVQDMLGNFLIFEEGKNIKVQLRTWDNSRLAREWKFSSFREAYKGLKEIVNFLDSQHAFYLGKEIRRAFEKVEKGERYVQDKG